MKQITPEIKAKIFALYLGAELHVSETPKEQWYPFDKHEGALELIGVLSNVAIVLRIAEQVSDRFDQTALHLQPLSSITDEDAIEVANMLYPLAVFKSVKRKHTTITVYNSNVKFRLSIDGAYIEYHEQIGLQQMPSIMADYLRSKGYALPAYGFSVDELVEAGVFKLKEVNND